MFDNHCSIEPPTKLTHPPCADRAFPLARAGMRHLNKNAGLAGINLVNKTANHGGGKIETRNGRNGTPF